MKSLNAYLYESRSHTARIFVIIKPGFLKYSQDIVERFLDGGWKIEKQRAKRLTLSEAKKLYYIHKDKDFYKDLCKYMSSDTTIAFIFKKDNIKQSEDIFKQTSLIKDELRKEYEESDMRNVLHSSDSSQHMMQEQDIYF